MSDLILLPNAMRTNLLAIQRTQSLIDRTTLRLATGLKVTSALDNPDAFFAAGELRSRAEDLSRLLDGIGQNIHAIEEADHGVKAELKILDLAESYLLDIEKKFLNGEIDLTTGPAVNETYVTFNAPANFTQYVSGQDTPASGPVVVTGNNQVEFLGNLWKRLAFNYNITANTYLEFEFRSTQIPEIATIGFDNDTNFGNDNDRFWIYGTQTSGITYSAPFPTYDYTDIGNWETITIPVGTFFTGNFNYINFVADDDVAPIGNSGYRNITLREGPVTIYDTQADTASIEKEYLKILTQLDDIARDAHYRGINLLKSENMTSVFNAEYTNKLVTEGLDATYRGLGLNVEGFNSVEDVREKISEVREARKILRGFGQTLSNDLNILLIRNQFTQSSINTFKAGADDLTVADMNEEGGNLLALQTRQQLGITSLSLASQSRARVIDVLT